MSRLGSFLFVALLVGVVGCDHTTKHLARAGLGDGQPVTLLPDVLALRYVANTDTAFGVLKGFLSADARWFVVSSLQTVASLVIVAWVARRWRAASLLERAAGALVLGGAIGNLSDRLMRGHVIDFIHVSYWPVFNVADIAVCVGVGLLFLASRREARLTAAPGS